MTGREKSGPENYAPPDRRAPKKWSDVDQAAVNVVEGEIREFVRRDQQQRSKADAANDPTPENELIRRVARVSTEEIDQVILELQRVRDMLHGEGERLNREIARYASLNQQLMTAMKVITENLIQWKGTSVNREQLIAEFKARWLGGNLVD
jgi:predicted RNase H-like nuclease (RuvC/YqgF family)